MTVIIAGYVRVEPEDRDRYVEGHQNIVARAREHPGCLDVAICADPLDHGRINIFEHWESAEVLDAWRAISPAPAVSAEIRDAVVAKHVVASSGPPFD